MRRRAAISPRAEEQRRPLPGRISGAQVAVSVTGPGAVPGRRDRRVRRQRQRQLVGGPHDGFRQRGVSSTLTR